MCHSWKSVRTSGHYGNLSVLRIRDVYPESRIQKQQQKRGVKKKFCHTFYFSHKIHKTEYYYIFYMLKNKIWPNPQELFKFLPNKFSLSSQKYGFGIRDPGSEIRDPGSEIRDPRSGIRDPRSEIRDPRSGIRKKTYSGPGSRGQKDTGSQIPDPDPQHCNL